MVLFVSFHIYCSEGSGGAEVLACAAANALGFVDSRNIGSQLVVGVKRNHLDSTCRAMALAVAAVYTVADRDTVVFDPYGVTNLCA